jgi:hypothetical protein
MNHRISFLVASLLITGCRHPDNQQAPNDSLRIGAAEIDITPPSGYRMAGYFDERLSTGTHDPLQAKALVLQQGKQQIALVFCDLLGISLHVSTNARARASHQTGIPVEHIMICATHSHTGPLFDDVRRQHFHKLAVAKYGQDPTEKIYYPDFLTEALVKVIHEAQKALRPARLETAILKQEGVTFNRRFLMKNGKVAFNPGQQNTNIVRAAGPVDTDLSFLLATDLASGRPFAGATVFAMHSDTMGGTEYGADYAYYLQQTLRQAYGARFISAFAAGTCGDLNHINVKTKDPVKGPAVTERIGTTLGQTILSGAGQLQTITQPSLAVRRKTFRAQLQEITPQQLADARSKIDKLGDPQTDFIAKVVAVKTLDLAELGKDYPVEVQVFRIDADTAIVCLPGEIFVELGQAIKQASPFKRTIVIALANDRPGYVPTRKAFVEGSYEVTNSRLKPGSGELLVETATELLGQIKN